MWQYTTHVALETETNNSVQIRQPLYWKWSCPDGEAEEATT